MTERGGVRGVVVLESPVSAATAEQKNEAENCVAWRARHGAERRGPRDFHASSIAPSSHMSGGGSVDAPYDWPATAEVFEAMHRSWCGALLGRLSSSKLANATYGRAAKIIAVYLKSRVVLGGHHEHPFAAVIHPPIDRILLQGLAGHMREREPELAKRLRTTAWTSLDEAGYDDLIACLRRAGLHQPAFWHMESFWDPRGDEE